MKIPGRIHLSTQEVSELKTKIEQNTLGEKEQQILLSILSAMVWLTETLAQSKLSLKRLKKMVFGDSSEKLSKIFAKQPASRQSNPPVTQRSTKPAQGHGRNGKDKYDGAAKVHFTHQELAPGNDCVLCLRGKLYLVKDPGSFLLISGSQPITATVFSWDILRCNACGELFKPTMPDDVRHHLENRPKNGAPVFDHQAKAMMALLRYGGGVPSYRLQTLQDYVKVPVSTSTQWDKLEEVANAARFAYQELVKCAANGDIMHNDDTGMKVLSQLKEIKAEQAANNKAGKKAGRTGIFTTAVVIRSKISDSTRDIVLFFTGRQHAGENLNDVLQHRDAHRDPPIQMCDALSRNLPKDFKTQLCNCNTHARRGFVEVADNFDEAVFVLEQYAKVYKNEAFCQHTKMNYSERLAYHQQHSQALMSDIIKLCNDKLANQEVEPNSTLGQAMIYMQKHWDQLTKFLSIPGAPIDNNIAERKLKRAILHRKNSLFYKTDMGAKVGDILMSLIQTCVKAQINPLDYLVALQDHAKAVFTSPQAWLPWNYHEQLSTPSSHH